MLTYNNHPCALQLLNKKQRIPLVYSNAHVCLGVCMQRSNRLT